MVSNSFQIVAAAPGRQHDVLAQIASRLNSSFNVEVGTLQMALSDNGVCVAVTTNLEEAARLSAVVLNAGADTRIIDQNGAVVSENRAQRMEEQPRTADTVTEVNGQAPRRTRLTNDFDPNALDERSLVMLDGSADQPLASSADALPQLDTSHSAAEVPAQTGSSSPVYAPHEGTPTSEIDTATVVDQYSAGEITLEDSSGEIPPPRTMGLHRGASSSPSVATSGGPAETESASRGHTSIYRANPQTASIGRPASRFSIENRQLRLMRQWFSEHPFLRIVAGFVVALSLGAPLPMCYADYVMTSRVQPLREDLSTAKEYGDVLSRLPTYKTPQQISDRIDGIRLRHSIYTFILWTSLCGVILAMWFRFV